ncbi:class A beta-lactamase [Sphingobium phenoxybenzoativorans]
MVALTGRKGLACSLVLLDCPAMLLFRSGSAFLLSLMLAVSPLPTAFAIGPANAPAPHMSAEDSLRAEFARFATMTDGTVGIAVRRIGDDHAVMLNGNTLFPMASTYKVAVAGAILTQVDRGQVTLDTMIPVDRSMMVSDGIADMMPHPGLSLSVYNLLELMLTRSDNSATDVLVKQAGGPQAITGWLRSVGIRDQRVDGNTAQLLYRAMGISPAGGSFARNVDMALQADPALRERDARDLPNLAFAADPRDTSTPEAMLDLLTRIAQGRALKPDTTRTLLDIMARCHTGQNRLKALLPPGTPIAHKTGTLNGLANDVGIVTLPDGSTMAIAVFVMKDSKGRDVRDRIMAEAARAAHDYYLFSKV